MPWSLADDERQRSVKLSIEVKVVQMTVRTLQPMSKPTHAAPESTHSDKPECGPIEKTR